MPSPTHACPQCGFGLVHTAHPKSRDHLRHRLAELNFLIAGLTAERDALQAQSDAIVYPILSLPPETTVEIFEHCVVRRTSSSPSAAPLLLTQVCRRWRQIALATPRLWKSVTPEELIKMWLSRSGNLPLDHMPPAFALLGGDAFTIPLSSITRLNFGDALLPLLRKISVENYHLEGGNVLQSIVIRNAPTLQEAHIVSIPGRTLHLPWHQLKSLTLRSIRQRCSELQHLNVDTTGTIAVPSTVNLPRLESLEMISEDGLLLDHLTLPQLRRLALAENCHSLEPYVHAVGAFIYRSKSPLHDIELPIRSSAPDDTFRAFLLPFSDSVSRLTLTWRHGNSTLRRILPTLAMPDLLPLLERLTLRGSPLMGKEYRALADALCRRRAASTSVLQFLLLDFALSGLFSGNSPAQTLDCWQKDDSFLALTIVPGIRVRVCISGTSQEELAVFDSIDVGLS
ncbi:hypothetical protein FB45DRAFT_1026184 [Roridomyces roridus]|uniref:F-box domain-containing protein n=1 Tax=Roridomyces roridus TaxID=1738132 RepID=A0AAD7C0D8_9AGAR|nr:hypothetical protein FB45DRAFT_1026184 [Roridomyces roridus]